ncbi:MAG: type 4a pilus biogenesis protein PilO [Bacillota bacterium]
MRSWNEITNREKIMSVSLIVIVVSISFYVFLYKPKADAVKDINSDLEQTVSSIKNNQDVLRKKEELKQEYKSKLDKLEKDDQDQPIKVSQKSDLIVRLNELIDQTDVQLKTMESAENKETNSQKYGYDKMPIKIQISGNYNNILKFVNSVEELKYLIKINNLNLNSNQSDLDSGSEVDINAQINLVAFATDDGKGR